MKNLTQDTKTDGQVFHFLSLDLFFCCFFFMVWQAQITDPETDMKLKLQNETDHVSKIW